MGSIGICLVPEVKKAELIEELIKGQTFAKQLRFLLQKLPVGGNGQADELSVKILRSFEQVLCLAGSAGGIGQNALNSTIVDRQFPALSSDYGAEESEDSSGTKKRHALKDKRGCYKRRKSPQTLTTVASTMEDGQAWRKYGQKNILNAKFPRSYFRCTHKYDQDCKATKQVQAMEDNPGMYQTTYIGCHTCNRDPAGLPQFIIPNCSEPEISNNNFIIFPENNVKLEETVNQVDAKSDLTDNASFTTSLQDYTTFLRTDHHLAGFDLSSSHLEGQDDISGIYWLDMEDHGDQSEMELLARAPGGFDGDFLFDN